MRLAVLLLAATSAVAQPLTLKQAVTLALQNSPELKMTQAQAEKARNSFREARAQFIPNVVIGSGLAGTRGFPLSIEGSAPSLFQIVSNSMLWNRPQKYAISEARRMWESSQAGSETRADEIVWRTAATYLELNKAQHSLEFAQREIESARRIEQATSAAVSEGRLIPLEGIKARLAVARQQQSSTDIETQVETLAAMLRGLTGIPENQSIETVDTSLPAPEGATSIEVAVARAIETHTELKRLRLEVAAKEEHVRSEKAQHLPQLDLVAQYAMLTRLNNYEDFFQKFERNNMELGMSARFTIFDGRRISARVGQAEADLAASRAALAAARNDIAVEARKDYQVLKQRESAQQVAKLELDVARESLNVALTRFQEGRISSQELEQSRLEESARWLGYLDANFGLERARLDLLRQSGGLMAALR